MVDRRHDVSFSHNRPGEYWVRVYNECGVRSDTVSVHAFEKLFAPNVLTLNDDEFNEHFAVTPNYDRSVALTGKILIYDRYGTLVYQDPQYRDEWPRYDFISNTIYYFLFQIAGCPALKGTVHVLK